MVVQTSFDGKLCAEAPMHKSCKVMESELFLRLMLQYKDVQGLMPPTLVVPVPHASTCRIHIISLFQFDHRPPKPGTDLGIRWDPRIWQVALQHTSLAWVAAAPEVWTPLLANAQLAVAPLAAKGGRVKASALSHLFEDETGASGSLESAVIEPSQMR